MKHLILAFTLLFTIAAKSQSPLDTSNVINFQLQNRDVEFLANYLPYQNDNDLFDIYTGFRKNWRTFNNPTNNQLITIDTVSANAVYKLFELVNQMPSYLTSTTNRISTNIKSIGNSALQSAIANYESRAASFIQNARILGRKRLGGRN